MKIKERMMLSECTFNFFKNQFRSLKIVITFFDQRKYIFVQVSRGPALNSIDLAIINAKLTEKSTKTSPNGVSCPLQS